MERFRFNIVRHGRVIDEAGRPVDDRAQAFAVANRLAIDLAQTRRDYLDKGYFVSIVDQNGHEVHRESIDSAEKSG